YSVTVTSGGCNAVAHATISEIQPVLQPICIISVDNTTNPGKNMLVWEKQQTSGISHYKLWKETTQAGVYQVVTTIPYAAMSKWTDPLSNPHQRAWRYKISAVDSCGTESPLSIVHKTIHLTVNLGQGQDINLIWNHYQGFEYYTYYIHRYRPSTGWLVIDSIPGDLNTYTDTPLGGGAVSYFVAAKRDNECWASGTAKDMSGPFSQSLSNIEDNGIIDVGIQTQNTEISGLRIYPNPVKNELIIETNSTTKQEFELLNLIGQSLFTSTIDKKAVIDLKQFSSGIYLVRLYSAKGIILKKIVKE
ncbi:MAG: T9SS type A sorting domain-containing protein, partial [Bacteroidia bacterium]|nr:T9SS type A sorting domain-containing protein [Bacteroidia bacterium]